MAKSKYVDTTAVVQVLGNVYTNPSLLDNENYHFHEEDFNDNEFHLILFGTIYNLHNLGVKDITINAIEDYLSQRPPKYGVYKSNKGSEYLTLLSEQIEPASFQYYYERMKKMTLLRMYDEKCGMDLKWIYDPDNILDVKKKQLQEDQLDNMSLIEIAESIDKKIDEVKTKFVDNLEETITPAGQGVELLLEQLKKQPELGYPLYGDYINNIVRGARLRKFYLRSAATGVGKSRSMIADACYIGCGSMYDVEKKEWVNTGYPEPTMYIATEQGIDEIQTMIIAFLSGVEEEHLLNGEYEEGEWDRAMRASQILQQGKLYIETLPDFSLQDIESVIKRGINEHEIKYIFHDYLHTSMKILEEITQRSGGVKLREDNILFMISIRLKDLCNKYNVFIMTATQLNGEYRTAEEYDQNLLRGAKAIADKIDVGMIMLEVNQSDKEALAELCKKSGYDMPDIKISVYKNRRGKWKGILLWCKARRGICRIDPMFVTKYDYDLIEMDNFKIHTRPSIDLSAF